MTAASHPWPDPNSLESRMGVCKDHPPCHGYFGQEARCSRTEERRPTSLRPLSPLSLSGCTPLRSNRSIPCINRSRSARTQLLFKSGTSSCNSSSSKEYLRRIPLLYLDYHKSFSEPLPVTSDVPYGVDFPIIFTAYTSEFPSLTEYY